MQNPEPLAVRSVGRPWARGSARARVVAAALAFWAAVIGAAESPPVAAQGGDAGTDLFLPAVLSGASMWPELSIEPSHATMRVGETASFALRMRSSVDVYFLALSVRFDPSVVQVLDSGAGAGTQVRRGDFPVAPGSFVWSGVMERDGLMSYYLNHGDGDGSRGHGDLLAFDLVAVAEGASGLTFESVEIGYTMPRSGRAVAVDAGVDVASALPPEPMACPRSGDGFRALTVGGAPSDRPAAEHPDLNLAIRGQTPAAAYRRLVEYNGAADHRAPQIAGLVPDAMRQGEEVRFAGTYHVNDWDWGSDRRGGPIRDWPVTMAQLETARGDAVRVPGSGYSIGDGMQALVLLAQPDRLTLKYTREDNVVRGYALHLENVCVDPDLLSLYERLDREGRGSLPALAAGQVLGVARSGGVRFAIRDTGQFMDPRARKDWWRGW